MSAPHAGRRFKALRIAVYAIVLIGLIGASFGIGLHAGLRRTVVFRVVRSALTTVAGTAGRLTGSPPRDDAPRSTSEDRPAPLDAVSLARAQSDDKPPADIDEWSGFYRIATTEKDLAGFKPLNAWLPPVIGPRLQPWAQARLAATDGVADDTGQICQPTGVFRTTGFSASFLFLPAAEKIVIAYGALETAGVQRVYLNRVHPRNLRPTWNGDSVGYWDGDTLVVDSIGFNDKSWLHSTMEPHTEETHMIQRLRRVKNREFIETTYTIEDRKALTSAYTYSRYYKKVSDSMPEDICNDDLQMWREFRDAALDRQRERSRMVGDQ